MSQKIERVYESNDYVHPMYVVSRSKRVTLKTKVYRAFARYTLPTILFAMSILLTFAVTFFSSYDFDTNLINFTRATIIFVLVGLFTGIIAYKQSYMWLKLVTANEDK